GNNQGKEGIKLNGGMVDLYKTNIRDVQKGVSVTNGGVRMFDGEIGFKGEYGISLNKGGVALKNVSITGPGDKGTGVIMEGTEMMMTGVDGKGVVTSGTKMMMEGVRISNVAMGVKVTSGTLTINGGSIGFMGEYGVYLDEGRGALIEVNIEGNGTGQEGIKLNGGVIELYKTNIRDVQKGVSVTNGGVQMLGGEIGFKGEYGIYLDEGGGAILGGVDIRGNGTGQEGIKLNGGRIELYKTNVREVQKGVSVESGGVQMLGGEIGFKGEYGISISGGNALLNDVGITGSSNKGMGVYVRSLGKIMMKEVNISKVGTGVWMTSGNLMMHKGSVAFNGGHGVYLIGGNAALNDVSITGQGHETEVAVKAIMGKVMIKGANISKVGTGMEVYGRANATVMGGEIGFMGNYGIYLVQGGVALKDVRMTYKGKQSTAEFIKVESGTVIAEGITIDGSGYGQGIKVTDGGRVWLKNANLKNVHRGMTITDGTVHMEGGEIIFKGKYGISLNQGGVALVAVKMTYMGNSPTAEFIKIVGEDTTNDVEMIKLKKKGIEVTPRHAVVVASHLTIDGNGYGQGIRVVDGGRVVLIKPTYTNIYNGMNITKGAVHMEGGGITFKGDYGVYLKKGHAVLNGVTMKYEGDDPDSTFFSEENAKNLAEIRGRGIRIDGNGYAQGISVINRGMVVLDDAIFSNMSNGVTVINGGRVVLEHATFSNVSNGVTVTNGEFSMKGGEMTFNGEHGISLHTGYALLKRVIMKYEDSKAIKNAHATNFVEINFIKVKGKGATLAAIKVMIIGDHKTQGVHVTDGGYVELDYSHITNVKEAITIQDGLLWMKNGMINFGGEYGLKMKGGRVLLSNVQMNSTSNNTEFLMVEEKSAKLKAVGVIINGNGTGKTQGIKIANGGKAWLIGTNVKKVSTGVAIQNAEVTMIGSSVSFTEDYGVNLTRVVL
ncbi:hypothetical protein, partial [Bartonella bovis]|uniref:hypothetical protein n=1 Tax=Bartonella bovis TaxID=155194 RepID=UPI001304E6DA